MSEPAPSTPECARGLMAHGMALLLAGLLTGLVLQLLTNPRMGLAAHLEGVLNGIFLLALGAAWPQARLSPRGTRVAYRTALAGTWGNWAVTLLAAGLGTRALTPLAGAGFGAARWQESLVAAGFVAVAGALVTAAIVLLHGFRRAR